MAAPVSSLSSLPLPGFLDPRGRIGRVEFWIGLFVHFQLLHLLGLDRWIASARQGLAPQLGGWVGVVLTLAEMWLVWVHFARRWHDTGWSRRWLLLWFVPLIGMVALMGIVGFAPSVPGRDRRGAPPEPAIRLPARLVAAIAAALGQGSTRLAVATPSPSAPAERAEPRPSATAPRAPRPVPVSPSGSSRPAASAVRFTAARPPVVVRPRRLL